MWEDLEAKLNKSGRKWKESQGNISYRYAELFCENCGVSLGEHDMVCTNLESMMYCGKCAKQYIKNTPIKLSCGVVINDYGNSVDLEYAGNYYKSMTVNKTCYFNSKGRYIKVKGKRFYV